MFGGVSGLSASHNLMRSKCLGGGEGTSPNVWWVERLGSPNPDPPTKICNFPVPAFLDLASKIHTRFRSCCLKSHALFSGLASVVHIRFCKIHTRFQTLKSKWLKSLPVFIPKRLKNVPFGAFWFFPYYGSSYIELCRSKCVTKSTIYSG